MDRFSVVTCTAFMSFYPIAHTFHVSRWLVDSGANNHMTC